MPGSSAGHAARATWLTQKVNQTLKLSELRNMKTTERVVPGARTTTNISATTNRAPPA